MKKITMIAALGLISPLYAADHLIEYKFEKRGEHFQRHLAELHSAWGVQGVGVLNTALELTGVTTESGTVTNIHSGFSYLLPVTDHLLVGPAAKYNYVAGKDDAIKAGIAWAYTGFDQIQLAGQVRYDHQLDDNSFDLLRTDLIFGLPITENSYLTTSSTNFNPVEGELNAWQEYELEFKYTGFEGIYPYLATTITTDNEPLGQGENAYIFGFYIPFN